MTRPVPLPSMAEIEQALSDLREQNQPVSASALAAHLGLSNPTFWRHFPDIAQRVADDRRTALRPTAPTPPPPAHQGDEERLRRENTTLRAQLDLAIAHIQRLTLDLDAMRREAEHNARITPLHPTAPDRSR